MPDQAHPRPRSAAWEGIRMALLCMLVSVCGLWIVHHLADRALLAGMRVHLEDIAALTAGSIDADEHRALAEMDALQPGSPAYERASRPLLQLREKVPDIYYAYTLVMRDGVPVFVLDSSYYVQNQGDENEIAMPGEAYEDAPDELLQAWQRGVAVSSAEPYTDKWGTFISAFAPVLDRQGTPTAVVGVDISMAQLAQRREPIRLAMLVAAACCLAGSSVIGLLRARSHASLMQREGELLVARAEAQKGERSARAGEQAKSIFLATMSHEIRTPLNGVLGMAEALSQTPLGESQREQVQAIRNSGQLLLVMLNDILDFSKIDAGAMLVHSVPLNLHDLVRDAAGLYRASAENKGLELTTEFDPAVCHVTGDPVRAAQVLGNLLSNAIKFTRKGGIHVHVHGPEDGMATVSVRDTGIGIPAERLSELFVPFSQLDTSLNRDAGGAGLGLAISQRLAELMGGRITAESEAGSGTTFHFSLPLTTQRPVQEDRPNDVLPATPPHSAHRVMVVEDVAINRRVASLLLERLGVVPVFAEDGEEAVRVWREQRPEVILMDVQMPKLDGREATRRIRAECGDPERPWIIALTGGVMDEDRDEAIKAGMNGFLAKPIDIAGLAEALASVPPAASD